MCGETRDFIRPTTLDEAANLLAAFLAEGRIGAQAAGAEYSERDDIGAFYLWYGTDLGDFGSAINRPGVTELALKLTTDMGPNDFQRLAYGATPAE